MITHELLRELLTDDLSDIVEFAEFVPNEIVYKALVIREFMEKHGIERVHQGIREFHAYERERVKQLGFLCGPASGIPQEKPELNAGLLQSHRAASR